MLRGVTIKISPKVARAIIGMLVALALPVGILQGIELYYHDRVYPGVTLDGREIGGLDAQAVIDRFGDVTVPQELELSGPQDTYTINLAAINFTYDPKATAQLALELGRRGNFLSQLAEEVKLLFTGRNIAPLYKLDSEAFTQAMSIIAGQIDSPAVAASVKVVGGKATITNGTTGQVVDQNRLHQELTSKFTHFDFSTHQIPLLHEDLRLTDEQLVSFQTRADALIKTKLSATIGDQNVTYTGEGLLSFLAPAGGIDEVKVAQEVTRLSALYNSEPQNPVFKFVNGRVEEFLPSKPGVTLKESEAKQQFAVALAQLEKTGEDQSVALAITEKQADTQTADVNNLGITELIGVGTSSYRGSISARIYNISLGSSKFDGVLLAPGETFSFNQVVGDVSAYTGYKQSYIIQNGATVLGDGGGLCQVSTTLFRAVLNAGLPIVERRGHSYRVGYYEQDSGPGIDATVYYPTTDFKFKNDTPGHILIQTYADPKAATLRFELYGTSDGRVATVGKPVISSTTPPPEDLYIDDPTKPIGSIEQIDWKAWGAKVSFKYSVVRDGETIYDKTFYTNYQPWQAKFLTGTAPVQ